MKIIYNRNCHLLLFPAIVFLLTAYTFAGSTNSSDDDSNSLPNGVYIHQLDNGMQVLLIENPALPMVGVNVVVKVGSAYETFATSGMSHMLEHLLFNGTDYMTQKELYDATDRIGGYNNANTGDYYTNYMMVTPAENITEGMKLQAGMLFHSIMPEEKFEKEKGIVMEEIAKSLGNSAEQAERNIISIIYDGHALSLPTLGTYETIKGMIRNDVYEFYKNYYVPNNMIMSVIGNFKSDEMLNTINEIYGNEKPGSVSLPFSPAWGTGFEKQKSDMEIEGEVFHRFYKGEQYSVNIIYALPENLPMEFFNLFDISISDQKDTLQNILDGKFPEAVEQITFSTRLYPIKNYLQANLKIINDSNLSEKIDLFKEELQKMDHSLSSELINTEAIKTRTNFYKNVEKPHMFGIYNASTFAEYGIESVFKSYSQAGYIEAGEMLAGFSLNAEPVVIIQHPLVSEETKAVDEAIQTNLFENGENKPVIIVKQNSSSELLAIHYLVKNKAAYEEKFGKDAATIWHDAFGQRLKSEKNKKVSSKYGLTFSVNDNPYIPMDNIYLSPAFGYIRVEGLADDVAGVINYLNAEMLSFVPTKTEFDKTVKKLRGIMMMKKENKAKQVFEDAYKNFIYESGKYSSTGEQVTYENLLAFGKEYFNPQNMIISVVSPSSTEGINGYFKDFTKASDIQVTNERAYQRNYATITDAHTVEDTVGGEQAYLFYGYTNSVEEEDKAPLQVLSLLLRDKIIFDVREKQGMAYRMSAGINIINDKALININLGTRPDNVEKLVPQLPSFFTTEYAGAFKEEELTKSVNMYLGRMMFRRLSSINQAYYLAHSYYFDGDIYADEEALNKMKEVKIDDVIRVAEKYLNVTNPVKVIIR